MEELKLPFDVDDCESIAERAAQGLGSIDGDDLDFSALSLAQVDRYIETLRERKTELDGAGFGQLIELGVYLGEVIRRKVGGRWSLTSDTALAGMTQMPYVLELSNDATVNPIEKPVKRFNDPEETDCRAMFDAFTSIGAVSRESLEQPPKKPWWRIW